MALLDELPLDILLAVVKWLKREHRHGSVFYELVPVASVSTSLRQLLLPLLYRDLVFESPKPVDYELKPKPIPDNSDGKLNETESNAPPILTIRTRHNAALANSAGCSEYVQCVSLFTNRQTDPDDIVRAVRDDMDAGNETKWPNLRSYAYNYPHKHFRFDHWFSCSDIIRKLDKELPKLRQASPVTCSVSSGITPFAYTPSSVSFLTQLTSLRLGCNIQRIDANHLPQLFAPTLVDVALYGVNPEKVWNLFYDGQEGQTVVFARLRRLIILFENPLRWRQNTDLPPHLQGTTRGMLTKRSVWTAGAASGKPGCRVPLFPVLCTLACTDMAYNLYDFISRTQCHNSLISLYVGNGSVYFEFDAELFKNLESVEFKTRFPDTNEEITGSVDLYKSAFTNLLCTKTNIQRIAFRSSACDALFQVPPDIGCVNLRSLLLGVEIDFKSMLRLLSNLKHLIELELNVDYAYIYNVNGEQENGAGYIDELQPPQGEYLPVSSTLRCFTCCLYSPKGRRCYTASYGFELALHLPALESMTLGVDKKGDVAFFQALLGRFLQEQSGSPYMNDGLLNAKVVPYSW